MADTTSTEPTSTEPTLTLENVSGRIQVFNLTLGHGATRHLFKRANEKGEQRVVLPPTFTLLAGEKREGLAPGLLAAPEVKNAVAAKKIRATLVEPPAQPQPMTAIPQPSAPTPSEPSSSEQPAEPVEQPKKKQGRTGA